MARGSRSGISGGEVQIAAVGWGTSHSVAATLEPAINFPAGGAWSQFFSVPGARSDEYRESSSDERHRNEANWAQPEGLRRKSRHTSLSSSAVGPPQPSDSASSGAIFSRNAARAKVDNRL